MSGILVYLLVSGTTIQKPPEYRLYPQGLLNSLEEEEEEDEED